MSKARPHVSSKRPNDFEVQTIAMRPNGLVVTAAQWGVIGSTPPPTELPESGFTEDELELHFAYWAMLDAKYEAWWEEHKTTPAAAHAATAQAIEAKAAHKEAVEKTAALDAAFVANRDLNERLEKRNADLEALAESKAAELALFDVQIAEKRAALKAVAESTEEKSNARE